MKMPLGSKICNKVKMGRKKSSHFFCELKNVLYICTMIIVGRPIEGISLNGLEYLMNEDNSDYKFFNNKDEAKEFLRQSMTGEVTDDELEDAFMFLDTETDFENPEVLNHED